jgi:glycosyltransferase involved in cell wall biosynthesis
LFTTEDFQSAYGAPANSVVIHDGADPDLFKYTPLPSKPIVFYIGSIHKARGIEVLIEAIRIARKEEKSIQLKVYGYGEKEYEEKISKLLSEVGGQFMGKINHDEVPKAIENSFVCINPLITSPYFELGEPIKLFEYMACGRPVIGSNVKQQKRIIESEKCGLVYHDNSPHELAEALLTLIQDPQKAQIYGNNGRKAIEERWNWKENVKRALPKLMELGAIPQAK